MADLDMENPEHVALAQKAAAQMKCPVCGRQSLEFNSVVIDGTLVGQLRCTRDECPLDETVAGAIPDA